VTRSRSRSPLGTHSDKSRCPGSSRYIAHSPRLSRLSAKFARRTTPNIRSTTSYSAVSSAPSPNAQALRDMNCDLLVLLLPNISLVVTKQYYDLVALRFAEKISVDDEGHRDRRVFLRNHGFF
jgi:hypothetical protein